MHWEEGTRPHLRWPINPAVAQLAGGVIGTYLLVPLFDAQTRQAVHLRTPALDRSGSAQQLPRASAPFLHFASVLED